MSLIEKLILFSVAALLFVGFAFESKNQVEAEKNKTAFFIDNACKRVGYVGTGGAFGNLYDLYKCNDGEVYTWQDMPSRGAK